MKKLIQITLLTCTALFAIPAWAEEFTLDDEYAARLCYSEASGQMLDCRNIVWIKNRQAEARNMPVGGYIARFHHRHVASPSRPWLAFLRADMSLPAGWRGGQAAWETRGRDTWRRVLTLAQKVNQGELAHTCNEAPITWGGPFVDCDNIQAYVRGDMHIVDCGPTANVFLARGHREPVPDLHCEERRAERAAQQSEVRARAEGRVSP
jgi:hypothetical protein